ncbi:MAG: hypothetical protein Q8P33_00605, partial [bacterium]|nr:hypothetical protein [bacterium]
CPVCVGVLLTWIGFLAAAYLGQPIDLTIPAVMMGGSVVGFTYYLEKKLNARRFINAWRVFFVVFGFVTVYALIREEWVWFVITAVVTLASVPVVIGLSKNNPNNNRPPEVARTAVSNTQSQQNIAAIRKKMEDCC